MDEQQERDPLIGVDVVHRHDKRAEPDVRAIAMREMEQSSKVTPRSRMRLDAIAPVNWCASGGMPVSMIRLLRLALQVVLFFLFLSLAVAVASVHTGIVESVALIAAGAVLVWLASCVRRIGAPVHQA